MFYAWFSIFYVCYSYFPKIILDQKNKKSLIFAPFLNFRKTPASPVQEKTKGKKQTKWEDDGPATLDYGDKTSGDNKIDDLVSSQYASVS